MAKNSGKVREFCQSGKVGTLSERGWKLSAPVTKIYMPSGDR